MQDLIDSGNQTEKEDANNHIQTIESRLKTYDEDKDNFMMQISKLVTFLQTNSIIICNSYSQSYINYLIDQ